MNTPPMLSVCALAACASGACAQVHRDIIVVSGQSNARAAYAAGIMEVIEQSGRYESPVLFHRHRSGNRMSLWINGTPGNYTLNTNYLEDFWSPDGSGDLQEIIAGIESAGDTWSIAAFFWFQGEGDTGNYTQINNYAGRFMYLLNSLAFNLGLDRRIPFIITAIDYNGDDDWLASINRTPDLIEAMRQVHFDIGQSLPWGAAFDSRGRPRLDLWHVGDHADPRGAYWPVRDLGGEQAGMFLELPTPRSLADLNADALHDLADINLFVEWFSAADPRSDLAPPADTYDLADIQAFVDAFFND